MSKPLCTAARCRKRAVRTLAGQPWCAAHSPEETTWGGASAADRWPIDGRLVPRLRALQADPGLLDPRGALALYRTQVEQLLQPSPEYLQRRALQLVLETWTEDRAPTERDIQAHHREEVLRRVHADNVGRVSRYMERLVDVAKIEKVRETVLQRVAPVFGLLGARLSRVIDDLVTDPVLAEKLRSAFEVEVVRSLGEADRIAGDVR